MSKDDLPVSDDFCLTHPDDDDHPHETNDDHETPEWVVDALFGTTLGGEYGGTVAEIIKSDDWCILEPCAGTGNIVRALNKRGHSKIVAYEIQAARYEILAKTADCETHRGDFLSIDPDDDPDGSGPYWGGVDAVIMNPPWSCGEKIWKMIARIDPYFCAMHVQWQAPCLKRFNIEFARAPVTHAIPIQGRPSYTGTGDTAKSEVGWFIRIKGAAPLWVAAQKRALV